MPLFLAARYFWSLGLAMINEDEYIGTPLDDAYIDRMITYLATVGSRSAISPRLLAARGQPTLYRGY